jgi:hypothetical protein
MLEGLRLVAQNAQINVALEEANNEKSNRD